ncbi:MAG: helix-turn-helix transcriptional regulator [Clostridia bacterium]|nr:helix-turn-helix transcriptional regulator [Clostridia bacterium]
MTLGQRIAKCRKNKNLSQEYVADRLGISRQAVSKWEQDVSAPDTNHLIALSALFDETVEYIATGEREQSSCTPPRTDKRSSTCRMIGIVLVAAALLSLILGLITTWLLIALSLLLLIFGILFITLKKGAVILSLSILLTAVLLVTVSAFSSGLTISLVFLLLACSVILPTGVFFAVKWLAGRKK